MDLYNKIRIIKNTNILHTTCFEENTTNESLHRKKYSNVSSFALWDCNNGTACFNEKDLSQQYSKCNAVFIGYNMSRIDNEDFANFHFNKNDLDSSIIKSRGVSKTLNNVSRFINAILQTENNLFLGAYLTDIYKGVYNPNSKTVAVSKKDKSLHIENLAYEINKVYPDGGKLFLISIGNAADKAARLKQQNEFLLDKCLLALADYDIYHYKSATTLHIATALQNTKRKCKLWKIKSSKIYKELFFILPTIKI